MTREEALNELKFARAMWEFDPMTGEVCFRNDIDRRQAEILDEAIKALEQKPILDKIKEEIDRQEKWLLQAGCNTYNVDIAFDAIKSEV